MRENDVGLPDKERFEPKPALPAKAPDERVTAGQLALEVLHEVRNPLEALGHLTYLACEEADDPEKVRKYMKLAEEQVVTLNRIASQTLGFARVSPEPQSTDMVELAEAALRIHQRTIETKFIHLVKDLPKDLSASVHSGQILQALSNLIVNALEALPEAGTLSLKLRKTREGVDLIVADNGHGIRPDDLCRMGEPFFTTKGAGGNGLGLAMSKRIVEEHKGSMKIRSSIRPERHGTYFRISLPN